MQPNIPMKFAVYVAWILLCKHCKFGEKIRYYSGDIEFFLGDYFFMARPVESTDIICVNNTLLSTHVSTHQHNPESRYFWRLSESCGDFDRHLHNCRFLALSLRTAWERLGLLGSWLNEVTNDGTKASIVCLSILTNTAHASVTQGLVWITCMQAILVRNSLMASKSALAHLYCRFLRAVQHHNWLHLQ